MTIEILCSGCDDCNVIRGKICQALADLNLNADVISVYDPHRKAKYFLPGHPGILIDGRPVVTGNSCSVSEYKRLFSEKVAC